MATKRGSILRVEKRSLKFVQARLDSGDRVEIPTGLWEQIVDQHAPGDVLVFVERRGRLFSFVQWVGTDQQAWRAVTSGELAAREYPNPYGMPEPWGRVAAEGIEADGEAIRQIREEPWGEEVLAGRREAVRVASSRTGGLPPQIFRRPNPYWCLPLDALMLWGFAPPAVVRAATNRIELGREPDEWRNPLLLRDLTTVYPAVEAMVRIGLWCWGTGLEPPPDPAELAEAERELTRGTKAADPDPIERRPGDDARLLARVIREWELIAANASPLNVPLLRASRPVAVTGTGGRNRQCGTRGVPTGQEVAVRQSHLSI